MARAPRRPLFPLNVWPPFVDAVTLVLVAFVLVVLVVLVAQRGLVRRLTERERELVKLKEDKARVERRLRALAQGGLVEVVDGKVILQGEVLFGSGSAEVTDNGRRFVAELVPPLVALLEAEPDQMVLVGGHTDDRPIKTPRFSSNWELSSARALTVVHYLQDEAKIDPRRLAAVAFGEHRPASKAKAKNRRIEIVLYPKHLVARR